ncbi:cellulose binding domain-containing protein [Nonomuraea salmonea]|uniref:cellulose binding domain-containing protein n=1 Tax=Nonomuraea salmonea TaxID=46181 RepID=UPI002FE79180
MSRNFGARLVSLALPAVLIAVTLIASPAAAAQAVRLQYRTSAPGATTAQAEPWLRLFNTGTTTIPLSQVKIRYYLTGTETYRFACSWAVVGCSTITGRFAPQEGGKQYLEVGFTSGSLSPGQNTSDMQLRFYRADWQSFQQSDDYSYGPNTSYADWDKVTVHVDGQLAWGTPTGTEPDPDPDPDPDPGATGELFDDFTYTSSTDARLAQRGWTVRSASGGPGVPGATWSPSAVSFPGGLLTLDSSTNGTAGGTVQTELSTAQRKFREGTYAARVRFSDAPPPAAPTVSTWCRRSSPSPRCATTSTPTTASWTSSTCRTAAGASRRTSSTPPAGRPTGTTPWLAVNTHTEERTSFAGWHDLVIQVSGGRIKYYVDGRLFADHGGDHYPETPMWIMFNQWFIDLQGASGTRTYRQQVDYVYFSANEVVAPATVTSRVAALRTAGTAFKDTVPNP